MTRMIKSLFCAAIALALSTTSVLATITVNTANCTLPDGQVGQEWDVYYYNGAGDPNNVFDVGENEEFTVTVNSGLPSWVEHFDALYNFYAYPAEEAGVYEISITVTNTTTGEEEDIVLSATIHYPPLSVVDGATSLPYLVKGWPSSVTLEESVQYGTTPYTFTKTSGSLPAGVTLNSNGSLDGTPTEDGVFTFYVTVTDSTIPSDTLANVEYTLTVLDTVSTEYRDSNGVSQTTNCIEITTDMTELSSGWYVAKGTLSYAAKTSITVSGEVNLILEAGSSMTITSGTASKAGIVVSDGNALNIYGQSAGAGSLTVTGGRFGAGIGGSHDETAGAVTINGGTVTATGGTYGAGIGGGQNGSGGTVTINGGTVTASGGGTSRTKGSGIGAGNSGLSHGTLTVGSNMEVKAGSSADPTDIMNPISLGGEQYYVVSPASTPIEPAATWTNTAGDFDWTNGSNWSTGVAPDANTDVTIPADGAPAGGWTIYLGGNAQAKSINVLANTTFQRDAGLSGWGNVVVQEDVTTGETKSTLTLKSACIFAGTTTAVTIAPDIVFATGNANFVSALTSNTSGSFVVNGDVSGTGTLAVKKTTTFNGAVAVDNGSISLPDNSAITVTFNGAITIGGNGQIYKYANQSTVTAGAGATLSGTGRIVYHRVNTFDNSIKSLVQNANWRGTLEWRGENALNVLTFTKINLANWGNAGSKVCLNGVSGYLDFSAANGKIAEVAGLEIGEFGFTLNDKLSNNDFYFSAALSGTGPLVVGTSADADSKYPLYVFTGDATAFTGALTVTNLVDGCYAPMVIFKPVSAANTSTRAHAAVVVQNGASVRAASTWQAQGGFVIDGTMDNSGGTLLGSVSGANTGLITYTAAPTLAPSISADYLGTVRLGWNYSGVTISNYGAANSTIALGDMTGFIAEGNSSTKISGIVAVDGTVVFNNGWPVGSADWSNNKCYKFTKLRVNTNKSLTFASTQASWTGFAQVTIDILDTTQTGSIVVGNDFRVKISAVDFSAEPAANTCLVPLTLADDGKLYNANGDEVTLGGSNYIDVTINGAASDTKLELKADGLYVKAAMDWPSDTSEVASQTAAEAFGITEGPLTNANAKALADWAKNPEKGNVSYAEKGSIIPDAFLLNCANNAAAVAAATPAAEEAIKITSITFDASGNPELTHPATYGNGKVELQGSVNIGASAEWHAKQAGDKFFRTVLVP